MPSARKRTHDERVPTLIYSAPGHDRIAKLFTENSLDEIKENIRKRLGLSSTSDFSLFYETDIALVNDDDFAAFEVHAHSSASAVNVIVKILSQTHVATPDAQGTANTSTALVATSHVSGPQNKKRRVAVVPPELDSISTASRTEENSPATVNVTLPTAPSVLPNAHAPVAGEKLKKKNKQAETAVNPLPNSTTLAVPSSSVITETPPDPQERPKKKPKKTTGKESVTAPKPSASTNALDDVFNAKEAPIDDGRPTKSKAKPKKDETTSNAAAAKATKKSKKDAQAQEAISASSRAQPPEEPFTFPRELANVISSVDEAVANEPVAAKPRRKKTKSIVEPLAEEKPKQRTKKRKREGEQDVDRDQAEASPDPAIVAAYVRSLINGTQSDSSMKTKDDAKKIDDVAKTSSAKLPTAQNDIHCPICQSAPLHIPLQCPIVRAGSDSIQKRIAELEDDPTKHSELIQRLRKLDAMKQSKNVNAVTRAPEGGASNPSAGHQVVARGAGPDGEGSTSSEDEATPPPSAARTGLPPPDRSSMDVELDAIIRGPPSARLTAKDIISDEEEEEEEEKAQSVVLENDDDDDVAFRRRSRKLYVDEKSSGEEEGDDDGDDNSLPDDEAKPPPILSDHPDSLHASRHSATPALMDIDLHQSQVPDFTGDKAVEDAMASDKVLFPSDTTVAAEDVGVEEHVDLEPPQPEEGAQGTANLNPEADNRSPSVIRLHTPVAGQDDPIQPADGFPPTPLVENKTIQPSSPSTPKAVHRMKDRNGKTPTIEVVIEVAGSQSADVASKKPRSTRSTTRMSSLTAIPPPELPAPVKRRRGPNKTPEQRNQEEAAKIAAREEKARLKAQAKASGKGSKKALGTKTAKDSPAIEQSNTTFPTYEDATAAPPALPSSTPISTAQWTVLQPASTSSQEHESTRDELRSSSPERANSNHQGDAEAPLFLPAESQLPFPYSQWNEDRKESEDEDEEEEVAAAMKPAPHRPATASYRRLTDIASQPMVFSAKPTLRPATFPLSSSFPQSKDKRAELYGTLPREEEDSSDNDSDVGDVPSHIPKSRQAGIRQR